MEKQKLPIDKIKSVACCTYFELERNSLITQILLIMQLTVIISQLIGNIILLLSISSKPSQVTSSNSERSSTHDTIRAWHTFFKMNAICLNI